MNAEREGNTSASDESNPVDAAIGAIRTSAVSLPPEAFEALTKLLAWAPMARRLTTQQLDKVSQRLLQRAGVPLPDVGDPRK